MKLRLNKKPKTSPASGPNPAKQFTEDYILHLIQRRVARLNIPAPKRPLDEKGRPLDPNLPPDVTMITDELLGKLYGQFAAMAIYVQRYLGIQAVIGAVRKEIEVKVKAAVRLEKDGTVEDKKALTEVDKRTQQATLKAMVGEGVEVMTKSLLDGYLIGRDTLSREMTRRQRTEWDDPTNRRR